jgi:hypothetical protein
MIKKPESYKFTIYEPMKEIQIREIFQCGVEDNETFVGLFNKSGSFRAIIQTRINEAIQDGCKIVLEPIFK